MQVAPLWSSLPSEQAQQHHSALALWLWEQGPEVHTLSSVPQKNWEWEPDNLLGL